MPDHRRQLAPRHRVALVAAGLAAVTAVAAGCGGSSSPAATQTGQSPSSGTSLPQALAGRSVNDHGSKTVVGQSTVEVEMDDFYFQPTVLVGAPGQKVTLELKNEGSASHTFTLAGQHVDTVVGSGKTAEVTVTFPQSGSVGFECRFHAGQGMLGALTVQGPGSAGTGSTPQSSSSGGY